jgi:hypothetical protein
MHEAVTPPSPARGTRWGLLLREDGGLSDSVYGGILQQHQHRLLQSDWYIMSRQVWLQASVHVLAEVSDMLAVEYRSTG